MVKNRKLKGTWLFCAYSDVEYVGYKYTLSIVTVFIVLIIIVVVAWSF